MTYLAEEIDSQPALWRRAAELAQPIVPDGARVAVLGCGTSWFIAQSYAALREGRGETDAFTPTEAPLERGYDAIVAISRSGTTTEVVDALARVDPSTPVIAIVGDVQTPLALRATHVVDLGFADERSVVQTRFATSALALLRASLGEDLSVAISQAEAAVGWEPPEALLTAEQLTFLGTGWSLGLAHEAALKLREASQSWTESYSAMEYRHGPISIAAEGRVTWMLGAPPTGLAEDIAATGALLVADGLDPLADLVRVHRLALARALHRGLDPDRPRNLTRSVILSQ